MRETINGYALTFVAGVWFGGTLHYAVQSRWAVAAVLGIGSAIIGFVGWKHVMGSR